MLSNLAAGLVSGLAYGLVGIVLLALGYLVVDLLTPGKLGDLIYKERNNNAAIVVASGTLAMGMIVTTAILTSADNFTRGLLDAAGYGVLGLVLLAISFVVVDLLTPGKLGEIVCDKAPHPAVWITAATHLAMGAVVAASIA